MLPLLGNSLYSHTGKGQCYPDNGYGIMDRRTLQRGHQVRVDYHCHPK